MSPIEFGFLKNDDDSVASNLIQVLAALLLRDLGIIRHHHAPVGDSSGGVENSFSGGINKGSGSAAIGSGWDKSMVVPPPQVLNTCTEILHALSYVGAANIRAVQNIPDLLKVCISFLLRLERDALILFLEDFADTYCRVLAGRSF